MKLNKKLEIGINAIAALKKKDGLVKTSELAVEIGVTSTFLVQIMHALKSAEIVIVKRGQGGGYTIDKSKEVSAYDIAKAVGTIDDNLKGEQGSVLELRQNLINAHKNTKL
jgi:DNA-binding IscR family transcriptional regulator